MINNYYLSKECCNFVKGIFILWVFVRHALPYTGRSLFVDNWMAQLIVAMFLFYSGFGVVESIKNKGVSYLNAMPKRRILTTLANFDIAVVVFAVMDLLIGREFGLRQLVLSFIGLDSVGHSSWYIFDILLCYTLTWFCFKITAKTCHMAIWGGAATICVITVAMVILCRLKPQIFWWDTILCYAAGVGYSIVREQIEKVIDKWYWPILLVAVVAFVYFRNYCPFFVYGLILNLRAIAFCAIIVLITRRIYLRSRMLEWFGLNLFPLYIYQRIPMLIMATLVPSFVTGHPLVFMGISFVVTILITMVYPKVQVKSIRI